MSLARAGASGERCTIRECISYFRAREIVYVSFRRHFSENNKSTWYNTAGGRVNGELHQPETIFSDREFDFAKGQTFLRERRSAFESAKPTLCRTRVSLLAQSFEQLLRNFGCVKTISKFKLGRTCPSHFSIFTTYAITVHPRLIKYHRPLQH